MLTSAARGRRSRAGQKVRFGVWLTRPPCCAQGRHGAAAGQVASGPADERDEHASCWVTAEWTRRLLYASLGAKGTGELLHQREVQQQAAAGSAAAEPAGAR